MSGDPRIEQIIDREMIRDCLFRYCRGIDRSDEATLRSTYWPDAVDNHGPYRGSADGFIAWAVEAFPATERNIHQIHNILIELDGEQAFVESYFTALSSQLGKAGNMVRWHLAGRYLDRFEKRATEWRVADRLVVFDWAERLPPPNGSEADRFGPRQPIGSRFPDDPLYTLRSLEKGTHS